MPTTETISARKFCRFISPRSYEFLRREIVSEIKAIKADRASRDSMIEFAPKTRYWVSRLLAAELYPDGETPVLEVARDESETYEAIRARRPSSGSHLSAEQYTLRNFERIRFLSLDCVVLSVGLTELPTESQLPEVTEWLLGQNIVLVDAEYRMIT